MVLRIIIMPQPQGHVSTFRLIPRALPGSVRLPAQEGRDLELILVDGEIL